MEIYHYTDADAFRNILESRTLWLTHTDFLNDKTEGEELGRMLSNRLADNPIALALLKIVDDSFETYSLSFSLERDLLSQWRGYCPKEGGYNIGFDRYILMNPLTVQDSTGKKMNYPMDINNIEKLFSGEMLNLSLTCDMCIYSDEEKEKHVNHIASIINDAYNYAAEKNPKLLEKISTHGVQSLEPDDLKTIKEIMKTNSCWNFNYGVTKFLFKDQSFYEEQETRFFVTCERGDVTPFYRAKQNIIIPYIKLEVSHLSFKSVSLGPCKDLELASKGLKHFLTNKFNWCQNDHGSNINYSKIPLR